MKKSQKKSRFRELTNKERFLFTLLAIVVLFWLSFKFIIDPQIDKISTLENERDTYLSKIEENNKILKNRKKIMEKKNSLLIEKEGIEENFFSSLNQPEIIHLLNELLLDSEIEMESISFTKPFYESISDEKEIKKMDISIPYSGSFEELNKIIRQVEKEPRKIIVNSLDMAKNEETEITGSINLGLYSLAGLVDVAEKSSVVKATDGNKSNPFIPYSSYIDRDKVILEEEKREEEEKSKEIEDYFTDEIYREFEKYLDEQLTKENERDSTGKDIGNSEIDDEDVFIYRVVKGDNITTISREMYGTDKYVDEILELNGMVRGSILPIGKKLRLVKR